MTMTTQLEWTDAAWEADRQITEADDPLDPDTSLLAHERNRIFRETGSVPIWN